MARAILTTLFVLLWPVGTYADPWVDDRADTVITGRMVQDRGHAGSARPRGCPSLWCACYAAMQWLGMSPQESKRKGLWRARAFARVGRPTTPKPGAIVVFARGRNGGHVGKVHAIRRTKRGMEVLLESGNDGRRVRTRWRSARGAIAWREL